LPYIQLKNPCYPGRDGGNTEKPNSPYCIDLGSPAQPAAGNSTAAPHWPGFFLSHLYGIFAERSEVQFKRFATVNCAWITSLPY
jgi:hypothetical protein